MYLNMFLFIFSNSIIFLIILSSIDIILLALLDVAPQAQVAVTTPSLEGTKSYRTEGSLATYDKKLGTYGDPPPFR